MPSLKHIGQFTTLADLFASARQLLPTDMSSAELQTLDASVRLRSVFSARTTNAQYVQAIKSAVEGLLQGEFNEATARAFLQGTLDLLGYDPARGFPGDDPTRIPPAELGSLRDLSSERRVKFMLDTQERITANYGFWRGGQDALARDQFPAYELIRIFNRDEERTDWPERFVRSGGTLVSDRMIAAKDNPVWQMLGNSGVFPDGLDQPFPPFAFGSGMGWREVPREEAVAFGIVAADEVPEFVDRDLNESLELDAAQFDPELLASLKSDLQSLAA